MPAKEKFRQWVKHCHPISRCPPHIHPLTHPFSHPHPRSSTPPLTRRVKAQILQMPWRAARLYDHTHTLINTNAQHTGVSVDSLEHKSDSLRALVSDLRSWCRCFQALEVGQAVIVTKEQEFPPSVSQRFWCLKKTFRGSTDFSSIFRWV